MDLFVTRFIEKKLGYVTSILMGHPKKKKNENKSKQISCKFI